MWGDLPARSTVTGMATATTEHAIGGNGKAGASERHAPLRVLIVEDDRFSRKILHKRLLTGGYVIELAENGREGLEKVEAFGPDLVLSDWMMPEMDGRELCAAIKERDFGRPIYFIMMTAKDKNEDMVSALDTGADEYLIKPVDAKEMMARLRAAERILRLQQDLRLTNQNLHTANRRINQELQATSQIQRSMLPQKLPELEGYRFAGHYQPSTECSGDFYDVLEMPDGRYGLVIGDVSGHGAPAMVAMAMIHMLLRMHIMRFADPAEMLHNINTDMFQYLPTGQYATMLIAALEPDSGRLTYSSAGHNPPLVFDAASRKLAWLPDCEGFPVKLIGPNLEYENHELQLERGQTLMMYTDGLVEAINPDDELYGDQRLVECIERQSDPAPEALLGAVLGELKTFTRGREMEDDLSFLIMARD